MLDDTTSPGREILHGPHGDRHGDLQGRATAAARAVALGFSVHDLGNPRAYIVRTVAAAWAHAPQDALPGHDIDAIRHDAAAWRGGKPGPGLIAGLRHLGALLPMQGPREIVRLGLLIEMHADYTILHPAIMSRADWLAHLRRAGHVLRIEAARHAQAQEHEAPEALNAELAFLGRVFDMLCG